MPARPPARPHIIGRDAKLWRACCQFEAVFVQQMLAVMRTSIPDSGLLPRGFSENVHSSMFDQAVAAAVGGRGQLGIALSIYRQLRTPQAGGANGDTLNTHPGRTGAGKIMHDHAPARGGEA